MRCVDRVYWLKVSAAVVYAIRYQTYESYIQIWWPLGYEWLSSLIFLRLNQCISVLSFKRLKICFSKKQDWEWGGEVAERGLPTSKTVSTFKTVATFKMVATLQILSEAWYKDRIRNRVRCACATIGRYKDIRYMILVKGKCFILMKQAFVQTTMQKHKSQSIDFKTHAQLLL